MYGYHDVAPGLSGSSSAIWEGGVAKVWTRPGIIFPTIYIFTADSESKPKRRHFAGVLEETRHHLF